jgi:ATP-dependent RNA helicase DHX57
MSATINQAQFSNYYGGAPCIEIPGFTHPVQDHYLEEILPQLQNYYPSSKPAKKATQAQLDRMRASFQARGIENERTLMALESLTRSERIDFNLVGATVRRFLASLALDDTNDPSTRLRTASVDPVTLAETCSSS